MKKTIRTHGKKNILVTSGTIDIKFNSKFNNKEAEKIKNYLSERINEVYTQDTSFLSILPRVIYLGDIEWIKWDEMKMLSAPRNHAREADLAIGMWLHGIADKFWKLVEIEFD